MNKKKIFIVDDHLDFILTIKDLLEKNGYLVEYVLDPVEIEDYMILNTYDLILMDIMMDSISGIDYVNLIRREIQRPIIFISAKNTKENILEGLNIGGDDYITKPFDNDMLLAKIGAHLRRESLNRSNILKIRDLELDEDNCLVRYKEKEIKFSKTEFFIVWTLANNPNKTFTKEDLFNLTYGGQYEYELRVITQYIYQIRMKFNTIDIDPIKNIWGVGYKWEFQ